MNRGGKFLACVAAMTLSLLAAAAQSPRISKIANIAGLSYSPDSVTKGASSVIVRCDDYIGPFCVVFNQLSLEPSSSIDSLKYGLYKTAESPTHELSRSGSAASEDEVLSGSFVSGSKKDSKVELGFAALVSPTTLPPPGTYKATIRASLYQSAYPPSGGAVDHSDFTVAVSVDSHYDVSVVAADLGFSLSSWGQSLDFGTFAANDSKRADILVRSNVSYSLSLSSVSGGALANKVDRSLVPYSISSNGEALTVSGSSPAALASGAAATYGATARYKLVFTILPYDFLPTEGDYYDILTVTLTAP